ncbi:hypothetical protein ACHAWF_010300 [Thalassiosira exigua]
MLSSALLRLARPGGAAAASAARRLPLLASSSRRTFAAAAASPAVSTNADGPPSVFDKIIHVTIIDPSGARRVIPALVGRTLYEACEMNGVDLGPASPGRPQQKIRSDTWTEPLYGEGATSGFDHVLLQGENEGVKEAEPMHEAERKCLDMYWDPDEIFPESRLACMVEVNKKMDGMAVYVPDRICDDIP